MNRKRVEMRRWLQGTSRGAAAAGVALLAALHVHTAQAGGAGFAQDAGDVGPSPCGSTGDSCARISGYIRAGSDFSPGGSNLREARGVVAAPLAGPAELEPPTPAAGSRSGLFLDVRGDDLR